jgi:hypothetical protein
MKRLSELMMDGSWMTETKVSEEELGCEKKRVD